MGNLSVGWVDGERVGDVTDTDDPLTGGGVAFVVEEGHLIANAMSVSPAA